MTTITTEALDHLREALAETERLRAQLASIEACCATTLIGFQTELGERNIAFICEQIARKVRMAGDLAKTDEVGAGEQETFVTTSIGAPRDLLRGIGEREDDQPPKSQ